MEIDVIKEIKTYFGKFALADEIKCGCGCNQYLSFCHGHLITLQNGLIEHFRNIKREKD